MAHKSIYEKRNLPIFLQNLYENKNTHLRNKDDFVIKYYRTIKGQKSIDYTIANEWNKLPTYFKTLHVHKKGIL